MKKWARNGCYTAVIDTEKMNADEIANLILKVIEK
nr:MAG TPA: antibiotic resistance protein [Caudoviricetes sp.]